MSMFPFQTRTYPSLKMSLRLLRWPISRVREPAGTIPSSGPYGVFQAGDGAYAMGCGTNEMWGRVARAIGKPDLQEAEGWATNLDRGKTVLLT